MKFRKYSSAEYRKAFQQVEHWQDLFKDYSKNYKVSIYQAIADRDWPMTRLEVTCVLKLINDKWPSYDQIKAASPDADDFVMRLRREELEEYRSIYG